MFGPSDFGYLKGDSGKKLSKISGLDEKAAMGYETALKRAKGYIERAENNSEIQGDQLISDAEQYKNDRMWGAIGNVAKMGLGLADQFGAFDGLKGVGGGEGMIGDTGISIKDSFTKDFGLDYGSYGSDLLTKGADYSSAFKW